MRKNDQQLGQPMRAYQDTKANIVALGLGAGDEGCTAYATDTDQLGAYNGAAWIWTPSDVQDWMDGTQSAGRLTGGAVTPHAYPITGVTAGGAGAGEFEIAGDHTAAFGAGVILTVSGSTGNDGDYTVSAGGAAHAGGTTTIPVDEAVPNAVADGNIAAGTVDVASGTGFIKDADSDTATTVPFDWAATTTPLIPTNDTSNWVYLDYNGGAPIAGITDDHDIITRNDIFVLDRLWREDSTLYIVGKGQNAYNLSMRTHRNLTRIFHFQRGNGVKLTEKAVRKIGVSQGNLYRGLNEIPVAEIDTSAADTFTTLYRDGGGGWTQVTGQTTIDNANYDDGSGLLQGIVNNQYGVYWAYLDYTGALHIQYGQDSYHLAEAEAAQFPVTRTFLDKFAMLIAKIVVKEGALENFYSIGYPWDVRFVAAPVANHNNLGGLQGGVAGEYYHLTQAQHTPLTTVAAAGYALVSTGANVWAADQTPLWSGVHTHAADIILDDGVGDSPQLQFIGGSNNDTILMFLDDDAVAGDSDLVIRLCAADTDSQLIIQDNSPATVVYIDANGNADFAGHMAVGGNASVLTSTVLNVDETFTNLSGNRQAGQFLISANPGGASTSRWTAVSATAAQVSGNNLTSAAAALLGFRGGTSLDGIGVVTLAVGLMGQNTVTVSNAVATTQQAVRAAANVTSGSSATITEQAMFYARDPSGSGTWNISTLYGLLIESMTKGTTNYAIHTNTGLVHFGDQVEIIGSAAADIQLIVKGAAAQSASLVQYQGSAGNIFFDSGDGLANSEVVWNEQGLDIDFRVEVVGQANALFVQGSDGNVGLGTATPAALEHLYSMVDAGRGIIIDAKGTSTGQSAFLSFLTVGTGAVDVGNAASQGWHITARGNAYVTAAAQNDLLIYFWDGAGWTLTQYWDHLGNVGIGMSYPAAKCHIDQASTTAAIPVLTLDQADVSDGFINFIGSDRGVILSDSNSLRSVRVEWNGTVYRLALHVDA